MYVMHTIRSDTLRYCSEDLKNPCFHGFVINPEGLVTKTAYKDAEVQMRKEEQTKPKVKWGEEEVSTPMG